MSALCEVPWGSQEASFEAIRGSLPPYNGQHWNANCTSSNGGFDSNICKLSWRPNAGKVMIVVTDEDSDRPTLSQFKMPNDQAFSFCFAYYQADGSCQFPTAQYEPSFEPSILVQRSKGNNGNGAVYYNKYRLNENMTLGQPYEDEIEATAKAILDNKVYLNILMSPWQGTDLTSAYPVSVFNDQSFYWRTLKQQPPSDDRTVAIYQFGHPVDAAQNSDFTSFDSRQTMKNLENHKLKNSIQYRILSGGGLARVFSISGFIAADNATINGFYSELVKISTVWPKGCEIVPKTSPTLTGSLPPSNNTLGPPSTATEDPNSSPPSNSSGSGAGGSGTGAGGSGTGTGGGQGGSATTTSGSGGPAVPPQNSETPTNSTPGIIVAAVAACGLLAAVVVYVMRKPPTPPANVSTGSAPAGGVSDNPLYQGTGSGENPLYQNSGSS